MNIKNLTRLEKILTIVLLLITIFGTASGYFYGEQKHDEGIKLGVDVILTQQAIDIQERGVTAFNVQSDQGPVQLVLRHVTQQEWEALNAK